MPEAADARRYHDIADLTAVRSALRPRVVCLFRSVPLWRWLDPVHNRSDDAAGIGDARGWLFAAPASHECRSFTDGSRNIKKENCSRIEIALRERHSTFLLGRNGDLMVAMMQVFCSYRAASFICRRSIQAANNRSHRPAG